jgi:hypothetical protein
MRAEVIAYERRRRTLSRLRGKGWIDRPADGADTAVADYLIELEIVDMPGWSRLRSVPDHEWPMRINPDT